jgi:hypothetical protein
MQARRTSSGGKSNFSEEYVWQQPCSGFGQRLLNWYSAMEVPYQISVNFTQESTFFRANSADAGQIPSNASSSYVQRGKVIFFRRICLATAMLGIWPASAELGYYISYLDHLVPSHRRERLVLCNGGSLSNQCQFHTRICLATAMLGIWPASAELALKKVLSCVKLTLI